MSGSPTSLPRPLCRPAHLLGRVADEAAYKIPRQCVGKVTGSHWASVSENRPPDIHRIAPPANKAGGAVLCPPDLDIGWGAVPVKTEARPTPSDSTADECGAIQPHLSSTACPSWA